MTNTLKFKPKYYKPKSPFGPDTYGVYIKSEFHKNHWDMISELTYIDGEWKCYFLWGTPHTESTFTEIAMKLKELNDIHNRIINQ